MEEMGGRGSSTTYGESGIFYVGYGVVASTDLGWLQLAFDFMTGMFYRVVLQKNVRRPWGWCSGLAGRPGYGQTEPSPGG